MNTLNTVWTYLKGKKTYITVLVGVSVGVAQALGYQIPVNVDIILGFLGLGFHRAAVSDQSQKVTQDVTALVQAITDELANKPETPVK